MNTDKKLRVLIVDDERPARHRLQEMLSRRPDVEVVAQATSGREAVEAIARLAPDLVFLDVQMPGLTGIEVVREVGPTNMPVVIFVTAYNQYAIEAFDVAALDYLLKPFDDERFEQALDRARETVAARAMGNLQRQLALLLDGLPAQQPPPEPKPRYLERVGVEMRGQMRVIPVKRIDFITADGSYAELHAGDDTFVIREQMQVLEDRLDPDRFFRIHRSAIVQLDRVESLIYSSGGDYAVRLHDGRHLRVSRGRYEELQQRLGLAPSGIQ